MKYRSLALVLTGVLLGFLVIIQSRSFSGVQDIYGRDSRANVFREIQILKQTNENLVDEINDLDSQLSKASDRQLALAALEEEIQKDRILAGYTDVQGPGIEVTFSKEVGVIWLTDFTNELWGAGAEAISLNNIRLTNATVGFDILPSGQISLNGSLLTAPFTFKAIGDGKTLMDALNQPQGILQRAKESIQGLDVSTTQQEKVPMEKVF